MLQIPVSFVEIRVLSHATEDTAKVLKALKGVVTEGVIGEINLIQEKLEGHYGNPITLIRSKIYSKSQAREIIQNIFSKLDEYDRTQFSAGIESRMDEEGRLYVRLDKQAAYHGKFKLKDEDPIHIQIKLAIPSKQKEKIMEVFRQIAKKAAWETPI